RPIAHLEGRILQLQTTVDHRLPQRARDGAIHRKVALRADIRIDLLQKRKIAGGIDLKIKGWRGTQRESSGDGNIGGGPGQMGALHLDSSRRRDERDGSLV